MQRKTFVLWLTGLSCSGKTTLASLLKKELTKKGFEVLHIDGNQFREKHQNLRLGFSTRDRDLNIKLLIKDIKQNLKKYDVIVTSFISPLKKHRQWARDSFTDFTEIFIDAPLEVCAQRDRTGLYSKAQNGLIKNFTGISHPYEKPSSPEILIKTHLNTAEESLQKILRYLRQKKVLIEYQPKDVLLVSFQRSGNTWIRFMLSNLIVNTENLNIEPDYHNMLKIIPFDRFYGTTGDFRTDFKIFPRIVKSHSDYHHDYQNIRSIYTVRDPRDVMISYYYFSRCHYDISGATSFTDFLEYYFDRWCNNVTSWRGHYGLLIKYEDIKKNPRKELARVLEYLDIDLQEEVISKAVEESEFSKMRDSEIKHRKMEGILQNADNFLHLRRGETEQWTSLPKRHLEYMKNRIKYQGLADFMKTLGYEFN